MAIKPKLSGKHLNGSSQVDEELATGEFFLRESVKKRKKMEEIKVRLQREIFLCFMFSSSVLALILRIFKVHTLINR